jgi:hypothetical protein
MRVRLGEFDVDLSAARDLSIPIRFDDPAFAQGARAFSLPAASTRAVEGGGFVGDVRRGGSCNCETHTFTPHGDGTHTEGPGHILQSRRPVVVGDVVCIAVVVLRIKEPNAPRVFRCPWVPVVPILGALVCISMMIPLPGDTWIRLVVWMALGFIIYFTYSRKHSRLTSGK